MNETVWLNGELVDDARVSVMDHGLTVGDGVFETMRVYGTSNGCSVRPPVSACGCPSGTSSKEPSRPLLVHRASRTVASV